MLSDKLYLLNSECPRRQVKLGMSVLVIMGITWLMEVVTFLIDRAGLDEDSRDFLNLALDVPNLLAVDKYN